MLVFEEVEVQDIVTYKKAKLKLNDAPLSIIRGRNLDRKDKKSSNASGKTVIASTIPTILYNAVPSSIKKNDTKDMVGKKGSFIKLRAIKNNKKILFHQYFTSSQKFDITVEGKGQLKPRLYKDAKTKIRSYFPMTEEQFFSLVYIDGRRPSLLQAGSSKIRFEFFEQVFRLNAYDILGGRVNKEYNRLKVALQELDVLTRELKIKKDEIPVDPDEAESLKEKQDEVFLKLDKIRKKVDGLIEKLNDVRTYLALADGVDLDTPIKELKQELEEAKQEEIKINQLLKKSIKYQEQLENYKEINGKRERILAKLEEAPEESISEIPELEESLAKLKSRLEKLQTKLTEQQEIQEQKDELEGQLNDIEGKYASLIKKYGKYELEVIQKSISKHKIERKNLTQTISNLEEFINSHNHESEENCPTCMRGLSKKSAKNIMQTAKEQCDTKTKQIKNLQIVLQYIEIKDKHDGLSFEPISKKKIKAIKSSIEEQTELLEGLRKKKTLKQLLKNLPEMELNPEDKTPPPKVYEEILPDLKKRISRIEQTVEKRRRLAKYEFSYESVAQAKKEQKDLEFELNKYRPMLDKAQDILHSLTAKISVTETIGKDISRLKKNIDKLKLDTKDFKIFESMRKAFGPKGLRKIRTSYFANQLQNNLNKFAPLIFGEKIVFKLLVSNTKFDILAERNNNISDIRKLSGSESSAFTCLLILSMLPFIRSADRCNLLILDEIESGLDEPSKELFVNQFLPVLMQIVPNIFIITPQSEKNFYIPNAQQYLVTKKDKVSTLEKVIP